MHRITPRNRLKLHASTERLESKLNATLVKLTTIVQYFTGGNVKMDLTNLLDYDWRFILSVAELNSLFCCVVWVLLVMILLRFISL